MGKKWVASKKRRLQEVPRGHGPFIAKFDLEGEDH